jgi:hypothetical protein
MKPEFRITKNQNGRFEVYYVESVGSSFFFKGKEVLKPYVTYSGSDRIFPFKTIESAIVQLKAEVILQTERL